MFVAALYSRVVFSHQKCLAYFLAQTNKQITKRVPLQIRCKILLIKRPAKKWRKRKINRNFIVKNILQKATTSSYKSMVVEEGRVISDMTA